jgi:cytoskeleton protein RodZ
MNAGEYNEHGEEQIGRLLERKRREKGLSLKEAEQATKIRTRYLEGLEREDYAMLPDPIYTQGFLKTYANFLGLDGEQLSRELRGRKVPRRERRFSYGEERPETSEFEQPLLAPGGLGGAERRISGATIFTIMLAVLVLAAVIGVLYFIGRGSQQAERPAENQSAVEQEEQPAEEPAAPPETNSAGSGVDERTDEQPADSSSVTPEKVQATVRVLGRPAGLTILTDRTVAADLLAQPGFSQTFEAQRAVTVSTGNAGAVEVEVNGQNLGRLGYYGQPVTHDFTPPPER